VPAAVPPPGVAGRNFFNPWVTSLGGIATAAAVAAVAILWMRSEGPAMVARNTQVATPVVRALAVQAAPDATVADTGAANAVPVAATASRKSREPDSYVVPAQASQGPALLAPTELANYIVAHSEFSGPLMGRNALSALVAGESAVPQVTAQPIPATVVPGK